MSSVIVAGDTSGSVTLNAPAVSGTTVITLPTTSGTMLTNKSAGTVLQVVNATYNTTVASSTNTLVDTGLSASITPTSATSKILVFVSQNGIRKQTNDAEVTLKLLRNSTVINTFEVAIAYTASAATNTVASSTTYLDSPATTSSVTYKTQFCSGSNNALVRVQIGNEYSTITLMEIAA